PLAGLGVEPDRDRPPTLLSAPTRQNLLSGDRDARTTRIPVGGTPAPHGSGRSTDSRPVPNRNTGEKTREGSPHTATPFSRPEREWNGQVPRRRSRARPILPSCWDSKNFSRSRTSGVR